MMFLSSTGAGRAVSFREAILSGLAPDGGLYVPGHIPALPREWLESLPSLSLHEIGEEVCAAFIDDIPRNELSGIVRRAWTFPVPLVHLEENLFLLELFHGPTLAFKDFGARFLALVLSHYLRRQDAQRTILVATSGDTGGAVAHGFVGIPGVAVYVLYPSGRISPLQERQITSVGGNVYPVEVSGSFDDCQRLVKEALADDALVRARNLSTANSISLGRLLPQIAYHVWGVAQWQLEHPERTPGEAPTVVVPSGNFGNLTAGLYARAMGAPAGRFVAATNLNDAGGEFLRTGRFAPRPAVSTLSNAMDVGNPSNVARLRLLLGARGAREGRGIAAITITEAETVDEIRRTYEHTGQIVDPHTAVGIAAARKGPKSVPAIILSTAHPAKFPDVIRDALGIAIPLPERLRRAVGIPGRSTPLPADFPSFRRLLQQGG